METYNKDNPRYFFTRPLAGQELELCQRIFDIYPYDCNRMFQMLYRRLCNDSNQFFELYQQVKSGQSLQVLAQESSQSVKREVERLEEELNKITPAPVESHLLMFLYFLTKTEEHWAISEKGLCLNADEERSFWSKKSIEPNAWLSTTAAMELAVWNDLFSHRLSRIYPHLDFWQGNALSGSSATDFVPKAQRLGLECAVIWKINDRGSVEQFYMAESSGAMLVHKDNIFSYDCQGQDKRELSPSKGTTFLNGHQPLHLSPYGDSSSALLALIEKHFLHYKLSSTLNDTSIKNSQGVYAGRAIKKAKI